MSARMLACDRARLQGVLVIRRCLLPLAWIAAACGSVLYLPARAPTGSASEAGHREGLFDGARGIKLYEQSWHPDGAPRAVLVVVHGLKDHSSRYGELARALVERGFAVFALDLRGHAHSEGERVYIDSFDDYLDDLTIFLERVRASEPDLPMFLFGHSMGGAIATLTVITRKPKIDGLLLSGAALEADVSWFKVVGTKLVAALSPRAGVFQLELDDFSRDRAVVAACRKDPLVYQDGAPARTARQLLGAIDEIDDRMEEIRLPILAMHGGADRVTPPDGSRELIRRSASPDKTLHIYDGLYHDLLHEPERARVIGDIASWLLTRTSSISGPGAGGS
jgi:alpha-beta hydrolase superfamily lysophospholipase